MKHGCCSIFLSPTHATITFHKENAELNEINFRFSSIASQRFGLRTDCVLQAVIAWRQWLMDGFINLFFSRNHFERSSFHLHAHVGFCNMKLMLVYFSSITNKFEKLFCCLLLELSMMLREYVQQLDVKAENNFMDKLSHVAQQVVLRLWLLFRNEQSRKFQWMLRAFIRFHHCARLVTETFDDITMKSSFDGSSDEILLFNLQLSFHLCWLRI